MHRTLSILLLLCAACSYRPGGLTGHATPDEAGSGGTDGGSGGSGCGDACPPAVPTLLTPAAGAYTGTSLAGPGSPELTPVFTWTAVPMATGYELQVASSCVPGALQRCTFATYDLDALVLAGPAPRATAALAVSTQPPLGRFYGWRVRACQGPLCSPWSAPRGLHVGQLPDDLDGDGRSDALLPGAGELHVRYHDRTDVIDGAALGAASFGAAVTAAGDVDGDGFADALVSGTAPGDVGEVWLLLGGEHGLDPARLRTSKSPGDHGAALAAAGDIDGDGLDDVAVGSPSSGRVTVHPGQPAADPVELAGPESGDRFGAALSRSWTATGDPVLVVGAPGLVTRGPDAERSGAVLSFVATPSGLAAPVTTFSPEDASSSKEFGSAIACTPRGPGGRPACAIASRLRTRPDSVFVCTDGSCARIAGAGTGGGALAFVQGAGAADALAVGDPGAENVGRVLLLSIDGTPVDAVLGDLQAGRLGASLAVGDFAGSGVPQLLAGAPGAERVYLFEESLQASTFVELPGIGQVIGG
jgi:hypothetical protein